LLVNLCAWVIDIEKVFGQLATDKDAMNKAYQNQIKILEGLIHMVQGDLSKGARQKIMCLITMDAHGRDVINTL